MQCESLITSGIKVMPRAKVFVHAHSRRGLKGCDISSPDIRPGSLKSIHTSMNIRNKHSYHPMQSFSWHMKRRLFLKMTSILRFYQYRSHDSDQIGTPHLFDIKNVYCGLPEIGREVANGLSPILSLLWRHDIFNIPTFAANAWEIHDVFPGNWAKALQNLQFFHIL